MLSIRAIKNSILIRTLCLVCTLILAVLIITACMPFNNNNAENKAVTLEQLPWCRRPTMIFTNDQDSKTAGGILQESKVRDPQELITSTPEELPDWHTFKIQLGFEVLLPAKLPAGSCLLSASGSIRNPMLGSNFTLTYLLPNQTALTIAQALQHEKKAAFQCSPLSGLSDSKALQIGQNLSHANVQLCTGARGTTKITFSADWTSKQLHSFFQDLHPTINWIPHV